MNVVGNIQFNTGVVMQGALVVDHRLTMSSKAIDDIVKGMTIDQLVGGIRSPGYPDRVGHYQYANKGGIFFPCDPRPEEVHIEDIALALSRIPRFNGQTKNYFSVAEHSWIVSHMVQGSAAKKLAALLHDSAEAYVNDMIRPLKYLPIMGSIYLKIESGIETAIGKRFDLPTPFLNDPDIKHADEKLVGLEVRDNISNQTNVNHLSDNLAARAEGEADGELSLYHWGSTLAYEMFMARFYELSRERAHL